MRSNPFKYIALLKDTGATKLASIDSLDTETGWETLGSRRKTHKHTMFYKMKNGLCPDYLASLVPATAGSVSTYPLRNSSDIKNITYEFSSLLNIFLALCCLRLE